MNSGGAPLFSLPIRRTEWYRFTSDQILHLLQYTNQVGRPRILVFLKMEAQRQAHMRQVQSYLSRLFISVIAIPATTATPIMLRLARSAPCLAITCATSCAITIASPSSFFVTGNNPVYTAHLPPGSAHAFTMSLSLMSANFHLYPRTASGYRRSAASATFSPTRCTISYFDPVVTIFSFCRTCANASCPSLISCEEDITINCDLPVSGAWEQPKKHTKKEIERQRIIYLFLIIPANTKPTTSQETVVSSDCPAVQLVGMSWNTCCTR